MSINKVLTFPPIWNVPYRRNPYFTGREDVLKKLHHALSGEQMTILTQPQAISGLGGIGKTQTAVEYVYRYGSEYQAVFWAKADSHDILVSDFARIAALLNLSQKNEQDQDLVVNAVKHWLETHMDWLLILDNIEEIALARDFIPLIDRGHVLLTTRAKAMGRLAQCIELKKMKPGEGALFLLRWANIIAPGAPLNEASTSDRIKAQEISEAMDGLPLALDQAGAYIEETACGLSGYLDLYRTRNTALLRERGKLAVDHPESIIATWSRSFEKIQQNNPAAAELLRLCAFLYPDIIPEEIITEGAPDLGPILQPVAADPIELNTAIGELLKFSLVHRDPEEKTLALHRLVQVVLKEWMNREIQHLWAERAVRAVNRAFPDIELATQQQYQPYLPHVQICKAHIEQWKMAFPEAAQLLYQAGYYLQSHAQYAQAEQLFSGALAIYERFREPDHLDVIACLDHLAILFYKQGKYNEAESFYHRTLVISERVLLGPEHLNLVANLNNLGSLYQVQGKYNAAEILYQRALAIDENAWGLDHPSVAVDLSNLARLYKAQGKYGQAEILSQRALAIWEQLLGPNKVSIASGLETYATLLRKDYREFEATELENLSKAIQAELPQENSHQIL